MWTTYWWIIDTEDSNLCGEKFFTELENGSCEAHWDYARDLFPGERLRCLGRVSEAQAEAMGLDTY